MPEWPPIAEPELLERLAMDNEEFEGFLDRVLGAFPPREYDAAILAWATEYPWARPDGPYLFSDGAVQELGEIAVEEREAILERFRSEPGRYPVLAIGSNGSPEQLQRKFGHFDDVEDRTALVLTGWLDDFDVGAAAQAPTYGAMPATIFPSPGTAVRAALLWVTATQFTQLAWSEMNYRLGRLRTRFEIDAIDEEVDEVLVFVSRFGVFHLGDGPIALEAVPARGRSAPALSQEAILDAAARLALGPEAKAEDLVRAAYEDMHATAIKAGSTVRKSSIPFESAAWTLYGEADEP